MSYSKSSHPIANSISAIPMEILVSNLNFDNIPDLLVLEYANPADKPTAIRFLIGDGTGAFSDQTSGLTAGAVTEVTLPRQTIAADFNGDGKTDFFVADHGLDAPPFAGARNSLILSSQNGYQDGASKLPNLTDFSHSAAAADIDGDGDLDIYVGNTGDRQSAYLLINDGTGRFAIDATRLGLAADLSHGTYTTSAFLDADNDGDSDLFLGWDGTANGTTSRLLINGGAGQFTITDVSTKPGDTFVDAKAADINGDGRLDLILSGTNPNYSGGFVALLINQGSNQFADETGARMFGGSASDDWSRRVALADVDGDGALDLVTTSGSGTSPILINDGFGHFVRLPNSLPEAGKFDMLTPADVNGDGRLDFVTQRGGGELVVFLSQLDPIERHGSAGTDSLMGLDAAERLFGGAGDDVVTGGEGDDYLRGEEGNDVIFGGPGFDDTHGNQGNDTVIGGSGDDWVVGGKDNDLLFGSDGFDVVYGNIGNDTCDGGAGNDWIRGGQNDDVLLGQAGDDWMSGDKGNDTITGGSGADLFNFSAGSSRDRVTDFSIAEGDRVRIEGGSPYTVRYEGSDTLVDLGNGDVMTLVGVNLTGTDWIA